MTTDLDHPVPPDPVRDRDRRALPTWRGAVLLLVLGLLAGGALAGGWSQRSVAPPEPAREGMELVFSDDFSAPTLDGDRWTTCYWWDDGGCTNEGNDELEWYQPDNVVIDDGVLQLIAREETARAPDGTEFPFTSGMVTSGREHYETTTPPRFAFRYGVVEVRARVPAGRGLWPALWLLPASHESRPEIDLMEVDGARPDVGTAHLHFDDVDGRRRAEGHEWQDEDLSEGWHTYTLDWRPDRITWYVDDVARWSFTDERHVPAEPMYLLANLAVGGEFVGDPGPRTEFPATFAIDHVQVWQRAQ